MRLKMILFLSLMCPCLALANGDQIPDEEARTVLQKIAAAECDVGLTSEKLAEAKAKWDGKTVVFDTNVLLNDPYAIFKYPGATVIIPFQVILELEAHKENWRTGKAARTFFAISDQIFKDKNPKDGVTIGENTTVKIDPKSHTDYLKEFDLDAGTPDHKIIATAFAHMQSAGQGQVALITDDRAMRLKAATIGLQSAAFEYEWVKSAKQIKQAVHVIQVTDEQLKTFIQTGNLPLPEGTNIRPNEFVQLTTPENQGSDETVARYFYDREDPSKSRLRKLIDIKALGLPFEPKNLEQKMALDVLLDPTVELVLMEASAGTGKTFITMLASVMQLRTTTKNLPGIHKYDTVRLTRPLVDVGNKSLGTLPGGADDKMEHDFYAFDDNLKRIWGKLNGANNSKNAKKDTSDRRVNIAGLMMLPFPKIRGRSLHDSLNILDEGQNTNVLEVKTFLTRAAEGSKSVILGDASQIDLPYLNERNNGLSVTVNLFTSDTLSPEERSYVGFVKLEQGVRTFIASLAAKLYDQYSPAKD